MKVEISARTDVGMVREHNEDNYLINPNLAEEDWFFQNDHPYQVGEVGSLLVVADGMGGASAGEVASKIAVETTRQYFKEVADIPLEQVPETMKKVFLLANEAISQHGQEHPETDGMGTTMVIAWLRDDRVHVSWVGDSRAYLLRKGEDMRPLSKDHSLVQEWIDEGKLTEEQAFYHPQNSIVTQSLGDPSRDPDPSYSSFPLQDGDRVLLCSDGLNGMLFDNQIEFYLRESKPSLKDTVESLIHAANEAGGKDNITLILSDVSEVQGTGASILPTGATAEKADTNRLRWLVVALALLLVGGVAVGLSYILPDKDEQPEEDQRLENPVDSVLRGDSAVLRTPSEEQREREVVNPTPQELEDTSDPVLREDPAPTPETQPAENPAASDQEPSESGPNITPTDRRPNLGGGSGILVNDEIRDKLPTDATDSGKQYRIVPKPDGGRGFVISGTDITLKGKMKVLENFNQAGIAKVQFSPLLSDESSMGYIVLEGGGFSKVEYSEVAGGIQFFRNNPREFILQEEPLALEQYQSGKRTFICSNEAGEGRYVFIIKLEGGGRQMVKIE